MGLVLAFILAGLAFIAGVLEFRKNGGKDRAKLAVSGAVLICSVLSAWASKKMSDDSRLRQQVADEALAKQTKQTEAARAEASAAKAEASKAADASAKTGELCLESWRAGKGIDEFLSKLPPAKAASLIEGECGPPPPWKFGAGQIRILSGRTEGEAHARRDRFLKQVLGYLRGENWTPHVLPPVKSIPSDRTQRGSNVYVVALNEIQGELTGPVCFWLKCMGVESGPESCGARDEQAIQGALGKPDWTPEK